MEFCRLSLSESIGRCRRLTLIFTQSPRSWNAIRRMSSIGLEGSADNSTRSLFPFGTDRKANGPCFSSSDVPAPSRHGRLEDCRIHVEDRTVNQSTREQGRHMPSHRGGNPVCSYNWTFSMSSKGGSKSAIRAISRIAVSGFKSIRTRQAIDIRPLTILAGANGSGKSSMIQPLLLLKQTLEASYDPGPLLLYGPNVKFSQVKQMFFHSGVSSKNQMIEIEIHLDGTELRVTYSGKRRREYGPPELVAQTEGTAQGDITLNEQYSSHDVIKQFTLNTYWYPIISAKDMTQAEVISKSVLSGGETQSPRGPTRDEG